VLLHLVVELDPVEREGLESSRYWVPHGCEQSTLAGTGKDRQLQLGRAFSR
jgi:hypothetical protein